MSNFSRIPDDCIPVGVQRWTEHICQTCAYCTWDAGTKCLQPLVLGEEMVLGGFDHALEHGMSIGTAYRLCKGEHWQEQEQEE